MTAAERPFVIAHEWAHLAGYADESEANFVAWLTCRRADPADREVWTQEAGDGIKRLLAAERAV